jgi:hypothetical protein
MPPCLCSARYIQLVRDLAAWILKQVQHDGFFAAESVSGYLIALAPSPARGEGITFIHLIALAFIPSRLSL